MNKLVEVKGLDKVYSGQKILQNINLEIYQNEMISLFGPSGCGKSTLLRCIGGLESITNGQVFLNGKEITYKSAEKRPIVMMFQEPLLFPHMTVIENITFGLKQNRVKKSIRAVEGEKMLEKIEMEGYSNRFPHELSGGQQQRVSLARSLIMNPSLLLLDEPFSSLDQQLRESMRNWVKGRLKEFEVASIFVTHDKEEAMMLGERVVIMNEGCIYQDGTPDQVYTTPLNETVAYLFSEGVITDGYFIPIDQIQLTKSPLSKGVNLNVEIISKLKKHGQLFYHLKSDEIEKDIWVHSNELFITGENAYISADEKDKIKL